MRLEIISSATRARNCVSLGKFTYFSLQPHLRTLLEHEAREASENLTCSSPENGGKASDDHGASCSTHASSPEKEVTYLRTLLKAILVAASPASAPAPSAASATEDQQQRDVAAANPSSSPPPPPSCNTFNSCSSCVETAGCAWCLAARSCRPDAPWQCQVVADIFQRVLTLMPGAG